MSSPDPEDFLKGLDADDSALSSWAKQLADDDDYVGSMSSQSSQQFPPLCPLLDELPCEEGRWMQDDFSGYRSSLSPDTAELRAILADENTDPNSDSEGRRLIHRPDGVDTRSLPVLVPSTLNQRQVIVSCASGSPVGETESTDSVRAIELEKVRAERDSHAAKAEAAIKKSALLEKEVKKLNKVIEKKDEELAAFRAGDRMKKKKPTEPKLRADDDKKAATITVRCIVARLLKFFIFHTLHVRCTRQVMFSYQTFSILPPPTH